MADKATYSALQKKLISVPAFSVVTVDYLDSQPNYFRVQNNGEAAIYCGTSHIPNQSKYDFMVKAAGVKMFAEPFYRAKLYIYNPSGTEVNVTVLSFRAEFDPLTLALSDIEVDLAGASIETNNIIGGFECSLPSGDNFIGNVSIANPLPAGTNKIGTVDVGNLINYSEKLTEILTAIGGISGGGSGGSGETEISRETGKILKANNFAEPCSIVADSETIFNIEFISNDGESNINLKFVTVNGTVAFLLKAGEVLNDFDIMASAVQIHKENDGDTISGRYLVKHGS